MMTQAISTTPTKAKTLSANISLMAIAVFALHCAGCSDGSKKVPAQDSASPTQNQALDYSSPPPPISPVPGTSIITITIPNGSNNTLTFDALAAGPEDGELIMLLHGWPQTSYEWRSQLITLSEAGYRVVAPDQRGYSPGARPERLSKYKYSLLVRDVARMARALGYAKYHLVGHDFGAGVAWGVAARFPQRVLTLTTISIPHPDAFTAEIAKGPNPDPTNGACFQFDASSYFSLFFAPNAEEIFLGQAPIGVDPTTGMPITISLSNDFYPPLSSDTVDFYLNILESQAPENSDIVLSYANDWYRQNLNPDRTFSFDPIGTIEVPTVFVSNKADSAICQGGIDTTANLIAQGTYYSNIALDDESIGHWIPELAPNTVSGIILDHINNHGPTQ